MSDFETQTRAVFNAHHLAQNANEPIFERLVSLISEEYFGFQKGAFANMRILDAGCGTNANASYAALTLGAAHVTSLDMGSEWKQTAAARLSGFGDRSSLVSGSLMELELPDAQFDFVHCAGVLHHTADFKKGFAELARVTKPGGACFISVMCNGAGVLYKCFNMLRELYQTDESFRQTIESLSPGRLDASLNWLLENKRAAEPELVAGEDQFFRTLFNEDLLLTIRDRIEAPTYHEFGITEAEMRTWYADGGFLEPRRITRYTHGFENLRRFLAPMYFHYDHPLSRFWFGEGYVQLIGVKAT